ncbi:hypothetical protein Dsin_006072 [Dipteronia sinensis]|uniref:Uncharacterized protein n=1 Tax=Dipteronia sinensis TaxID=43782 RepID=A0AAE0EH29_9ROSI|nr:hypothetical protein Dsin_006072 [Dipteronia sinensis]
MEEFENTSTAIFCRMCGIWSSVQLNFFLFATGTRVHASIFGADIKPFEDTLTISKIYHISNAFVKPIKPEHKIVENDLQWTINGRTLVKEVKDAQVIVPDAFSFVLCADLEKYKDCIAQVDVIALAIDMHPVRQLKTKQDQFVGNEAAEIAKLITTKPVTITARLKVVSYNGNRFLGQSINDSDELEPEILVHGLQSMQQNDRCRLRRIVYVDPLQTKRCQRNSKDGIVDIEITAAFPNPHDYLIHAKATTYESRGHTTDKLNIVAIHETINEDTIKLDNGKGKNVIR